MLGTLVLSLSVGVAAGSGGPGVAIPNGSTYDALINPAAAPAPGWNTSSSFVETGWTLGAQAPFGHGMACALNAGEQTDFPMGKTIYLRKSFALPANAFGLHVVGTVDNYADVYVNGNNVQGDVSSGNCQTGAIDFTVPNSKLVLGGANLAAVQASDDGSTASYFDMKATYGSIDFGVQPSETLKGSTIAPAPTVTITDADGNPVASTTVNVTLTNGGSFTGGSTTSVTTDGSGVATFSNLAVTSPGNYQIVATSDGASTSSNAFPVDDLLFGQQPSETQKNAVIAPAPTVTIKDPYGVGIPNKTVSLTLVAIQGTGTFTGGSTTTTTTGASGVATFSNLAVTASGQYKLVATSDNATVTSSAFLIADQIAPCTGTCSASGTNSNTTFSAQSSTSGGSLAVSVIGGAGVPNGVCGPHFSPKGAGSYVNLLNSNGSLTITWTLDHTLVNRVLPIFFDICLGAENLLQPNGSGVTPWRTKLLTPSTPVADPNLGATLFWGLVPDCTVVPWKNLKPTTPCIIDRRSNARGDVIIDFYLPYPWDASMHGG